MELQAVDTKRKRTYAKLAIALCLGFLLLYLAGQAFGFGDSPRICISSATYENGVEYQVRTSCTEVL